MRFESHLWFELVTEWATSLITPTVSIVSIVFPYRHVSLQVGDVRAKGTAHPIEARVLGSFPRERFELGTERVTLPRLGL
jgi:hypothetical protein